MKFLGLRVFSFLISAVVLAASCSREINTKIHDLDNCWNVNTAQFTAVRGDGILIVSMDGYSLQAPGCDDRQGGNKFEFTKDSDENLRIFILNNRNLERSNFIWFSFEGRLIRNIDGKSRLVINKIYKIRYGKRPEWY